MNKYKSINLTLPIINLFYIFNHMFDCFQGVPFLPNPFAECQPYLRKVPPQVKDSIFSRIWCVFCICIIKTCLQELQSCIKRSLIIIVKIQWLLLTFKLLS